LFNVKRCRHVPGKARFPGFISHRINDRRPKDHRLRRQASRLATVLPALVLFAVLPATTAFAQDPVEFKGHKEVVYDAKFLPDGKSLVTASFDQTLKLWDIESQKMLRTMQGHTGIVLTVDVSPDGRVIASGSSDRTIRLWDVPKSDPVLTSKVHDSPATAMATSKDGTLIATADDKGLVRIWTAAVAVAGDDAAPAAFEKPTREINIGMLVSRLAWRNDKLQLAVACADGTIRIINPADGGITGPIGAHDGAISGLVFSPNNQQIYTSGADGFVRRWPTTIPAALTFEGLAKPAKAVALHPNGSLIAVAGEDGSIKILKRADGVVAHTLEGLSGTIAAIAFNRTGNQLATGGTEKIVRVFDVTSGKVVHEAPAAESPISAVVFSADSKEIIVGTERGDVLAHTLASPVVSRTIGKHSKRVRSLAASTDGTRILTAGDDKTLRSLDVKTGKEQTASNFDAELTAVAFSANNDLVAVGLANGTVATLDSKTFAPAGEFAGHTGPVTGVSFNTTATHVVSSSVDGTSRLWDLMAASLAQHFSGHGGAVSDIAFQNDNKSIITTGADGKVRVETLANQLTHGADDGQINDLSLSANGSQYATAGTDGTVKLWTASNGAPLRSFTGFEGPALCVSLSADNRQVAAGGSDKTIRTWNVSNAAAHFKLATPAEARRISYSPNSTRLVAALADHSIQCFDPTPLNPQPAEPPGRDSSQTLSGHTAKIADIVWSPDGLSLRTSGADMTLRDWSIASPKEKASLTGHALQVYSVVFSPDGETLASASADKTVRLWDLKTNKAIKTLVTLTAPVYGLAFSTDGTQIAVAGADSTVRLLNVSDGTELRQFTGPEHPVYSVAFSRDSKQIAAAGMGIGSERNVYVWSIDSSDPVAVLPGHKDDIYRTQFNANGSRLLSIGYSGTLRIWDLGSKKTLHELNLGVVSYSGSLSPDGSKVIVTSNDRTARLLPIPEAAR
jgi:WD40 repeat protein